MRLDVSYYRSNKAKQVDQLDFGLVRYTTPSDNMTRRTENHLQYRGAYYCFCVTQRNVGDLSVLDATSAI